MADRITLVVDAGTSRARCHAFDESGDIVATCSAPWVLTEQEDEQSMAREFDLSRLWNTVAGVIKRCLAEPV
ncbi:MAG: hypothetical protein IIB14_11045, partial [Chloroflexi bacterium]|nr:hypothetical protein [Chloroflexota bacterium]